jgi:hypothetical protein
VQFIEVSAVPPRFPERLTHFPMKFVSRSTPGFANLVFVKAIVDVPNDDVGKLVNGWIQPDGRKCARPDREKCLIRKRFDSVDDVNCNNPLHVVPMQKAHAGPAVAPRNFPERIYEPCSRACLGGDHW